MRTKIATIMAGLIASAAMTSAQAADVYYNDYAAWQAAVTSAGLVEETLAFTASNTELANEVTTTLGATEEILGSTLTFDQSNTGHSRTYNLAMETTNGDLVWNDTEGGSPAYGPDVISLGDVDDDENDDAILRFSGTNGVRAAGFFLESNTDEAGEYFAVYNSTTDATNSTAAARSFTTLDPSSTDGFIGVVGDTPFFMAQFDEGAGPDDVGISRIAFAVPEPSSATALATGLLGVFGVRRRRRAQAVA